MLEDKTYSLTFHFRHAPNRAAARRLLVARAGTSARRRRCSTASMLLNLLPPGAPHKGVALAALLAHAHCDRALYVGDDASDEAVFRLRSPAVLSVRVERDPASAADLYLRGQKDVARLVAELLRISPNATVAAPAGSRPGAET